MMCPHPAVAGGVTHHKKWHKRIKSRTMPQKPPALSIGAPEGTLAAEALPPKIGSFLVREWDGQIETLANVKGASPWAAVLVDGTQLAAGCAQHWFVPLDTPESCGIPAGTSTLVLAWDHSRITTAPEWKDFWDIARQPGRRGLYCGARTTLEIALLADGVPADNVYAVLSTPAGVDRAFHRLDLLRPYVIWWHTPDDALHIMQQSSALMTSTPWAEITAANMQNRPNKTTSIFMAQPQLSLSTHLFWAIPSQTPEALSADLTKTLKNTSTVYRSMSQKDPSMFVDDDFWQKNGVALEKRFHDWFNENKPL